MGLTRKQAIGRFGETMAARHLTGKGMLVIARNWRKGSYELDLVCMHSNTLVFVEVKTRSKSSLETPEEALNSLKKKNFARAAREYLLETGFWNVACRFDLIGVTFDGSDQSSCHVEHIENVLDFSDFSSGNGKRSFARRNSLGSGHSPWQPW